MSTSTPTTGLTVHLSRVGRGQQFDFRFDRYELIRHKSANALIMRLADGKEFNLSLSAPVTNVSTPEQSAVVAKATMLPYLGMGAIVKIKDGRFKGMVGLLAKKNPATYQIAVPNQPTIIVSPESVVEATKEELIASL